MAPTTEARREEGERNREGTVGQSNASPEVRLVDRLRDRVGRALNEQKDRLTAKLDDAAETVRRAGEPLRGSLGDALAQHAEGAAGRLHSVASHLRRRDVRDLASDVGELARQRPAVFVGAGFAAGLLAGRFIKSKPLDEPAPGRPRGARTGRPASNRDDR